MNTTNKKQAEKIAALIEESTRKKGALESFRGHLGASLIGDPCSRKLWYGFRWAFKENFSGRMFRLFERGHLEEARFFGYLKGIGVQYWGDTEQFRFTELGGHFSGSMDGVARLDAIGINEAVLLEFKTSGSKAFGKIVKEGMKLAKPLHYAQTCTYASRPEYGFKRCLYMVVNKDTDELYVELVDMDHQHGNDMVKKAAMIINASKPPERLHERPTALECKFCAATHICHERQAALWNCRSCREATPLSDGSWFCMYKQTPLNKKSIPCSKWSDVTK